MSKFDANVMLAAADQAATDQLQKLEQEVAVLGGQVMQLVRDTVEVIHRDEKASVAEQIRHAEAAKAGLARANGMLQGGSQNRSEQPQPETSDNQPPRGRGRNRQQATTSTPAQEPAKTDQPEPPAQPVVKAEPVKIQPKPPAQPEVKVVESEGATTKLKRLWKNLQS